MRLTSNIYPAHIRRRANGAESVQTVQEHCLEAARLAALCLASIGLDQAAYLAALLHDMGKFTAEFRAYLYQAFHGEAVRPGSVIHTYAAVRYLLERFHVPERCDFSDMTAELLAYAAGAHHGLFDCVDRRHRSGFDHRLAWDEARYQEAVTQFHTQCAGEETLSAHFRQADRQLRPIYDWVNQMGMDREDGDQEIFFSLGLVARLLLSAVIEGDRQSTARYRMGLDPPGPPPPPEALWPPVLERVERRLLALPSDTPICRVRQEISRQCRAAAEWPGGIYRLNVPTGGGKTLSALRYALAHAARHGKRRIIFTSPLLNILEQNARVIRDYVGDDSLILEHHSNLVQTRADMDELDHRELLAENWNAPIVITTLVQLLNTLFSGKTTCIRRFQALCSSVLVIDEVQTVPPRMLTLFNLAVNFLAQICNTTVILCSATQPCLEQAAHPLRGELRQLVPYDPSLWAVFRRTQLVDAGRCRLDEIPAFLRARLEETASLLVVCNKKAEAKFLFNQLRQPGLRLFHLSAAMCPAHRRETLQRLELALEESRRGGCRVLCVSTQASESGVDISFGTSVRLFAGMDNAVQTAGRCNRNWESEQPTPVFLLECTDERLDRLPEIQAAKSAALQLLSRYRRNPEAFQNDLASDTAMRQYYHNLYGGMPQLGQDYPDGHLTLFDLLATNVKYAADCPAARRYGLRQAFAEAGRRFQVFHEDTIDVLVPYGKGAELIRALGSESVRRDLGRQKRLLREAKQYTVSLCRWQREALERKGSLTPLLDGAVLTLSPPFYNHETGWTLEPEQKSDSEVESCPNPCTQTGLNFR